MDFTTREFLDNIFDNLDNNFLIEIREITDSSSNNYFYSSLDELVELYNPSLEKHCYFGVSSRGQRKNSKGKTSGENINCEDVKALWFDFDYITLEEVRERIELFKVKPSYIVSSGNGYHVYYILDERVSTEKVIKILRPLTKMIGADPKVSTHSKVLRLPGTVNKKNDKWCEIIETNRIEYSLELFEKFVVEDSEVTEVLRKLPNGELVKIASRCKSYCISKMLAGVKRGERNTATLRLTYYFRDILKLDKNRALEVLQMWNKKNKPMESLSELKRNFNSVWDKNYKLLGCEFDGVEKFCKKEKCFSPIIQPPKLKFENIPIKFDTKIFEKNYENITGYELVFLGLLQVFPAGLTFDEIRDKCTTKKTGKVFLHDKTRKRVLEDLLNKKLIEQCGDIYIYSRKGQYNRGYVMISPALLRLVMHKLISQAEFKLLVLMKKYARKEEDYIIFPTEVTLSKELGVTQGLVSRYVSSLESKNYLEKMYYVNKGYDFLKYRILV